MTGDEEAGAETGAEDAPAKHYTAADLVIAAIARVENLSATAVAEELAGRDVLLVDLRELDERADMGVIPGSTHAPRGMLEFHADATLPYHIDGFEQGRRTIVYCSDGARSALAVLTLESMGYTDVAHLAGGMAAWMDEQQPVEDAPAIT